MVCSKIHKIVATKPKESPEGIEQVLVEPDKEHEIILYNDDVNTFDHVIQCLRSHVYAGRTMCLLGSFYRKMLG